MSKQESVLSYLLTKAGKTFKDLANYIGVEESTPYRWSRGTRVPSGQVWENLKDFLFTECDYFEDDFMGIEDLDNFRYYLDEDINGPRDVIIKLRGEIEGNQTKNTLEQYLAKYRDENGNEVELPKGSITVSKHPVHEYLEKIVGVERPLPEADVNDEPQEIKPLIRETVQEMIDDKFKRFIGNQHVSVDHFIRLVEAYTKYYAGVKTEW